jgi:hypothetical protein
MKKKKKKNEKRKEASFHADNIVPKKSSKSLKALLSYRKMCGRTDNGIP